MKTNKFIPLAAAIAALSVSPFAIAGGDGADKDTYMDVDLETESTFDNSLEVSMTKSVDITIGGYLGLPDKNPVASVVDSKQYSIDNETDNDPTEPDDNNVGMKGNTGKKSSGNIGANVAAGANNAQANDAAIAKSDAGKVFADAEVFSSQDAQNNGTNRDGSTNNNASLKGQAFKGISGNIGLNAASGANNIQQNALAMSVAPSGAGSVATAGGMQTTDKNDTDNETHVNNAHLQGEALRNASGNVGVNVAAGSNNLQRNSLAISNSK